jgi:YVTN family beta-propeller protein
MRRIATLAVGASLGASTLLLAVPLPASHAGAVGPALVPLHAGLGAVPPGASLIGPTPTNTKLNLVVTLEPRDPAALTAAVHAVSDPTSPDYRRFITPVQFAARYGPTSAAIEAVRNVLRSDGLAVGQPSATGLSIPVLATVGQVQSAFSTQISTYRLASGRTGFHADSRPQLPSNVASSVEGVLGLDTLNPPQPTDVPAPPTSSGLKASARANTMGLAQGQPTPGQSCAGSISNLRGNGDLDAVDLAQAYSFDPLYAAQDYGAGSTIALLELYGAGYYSSDIQYFAQCYGITLGAGQITQTGTGVIGLGTEESELDIETALELAPKANIEVYEGGSSDTIYDVLNRIVTDDTAKIVSVSWTNGCEAYVGQAERLSEATLLQTSALEGQSVFVASGDQGSEGCNVNRVTGAPTGSGPAAQTVDPATGTLYVANQGGNSVSVDSEGSTGDPGGGFAGVASVATASGPAAVALDTTDKKVFVADETANELTAFGTTSCNTSSTSGCGATTTITNSGNHLAGPSSMAVSGTTLYVGNSSSGTVAVYNAATNAYVTSVSLPTASMPSAIAVDPLYGVVYATDSGNNQVEYFSATTCNATNTSGCSTTPRVISAGTNPVSLVVDDAAGSLYVGNRGGGVTVINLSGQSLVSTISTMNPVYPHNGLVDSVALSPSGHQVLAVVSYVGYPWDTLVTIDPTSNSVTAIVYLESSQDPVGSLVTDGVRDYAWILDSATKVDIVQNLNLAVTDPSTQPGVTSVGGTSISGGLGPPPTETTWNSRKTYSDGAGGGGMSSTFAMPVYQQALLGSAGNGQSPCAGGVCRETPDVSADADPAKGYIVYNTSNHLGGWTAFGGTSASAPLWAAVLAVVSSADGTTSGVGPLNPALYALASTGTSYFNDVTTGDNDYNATNSGQYPAQRGYDMATGLGTPIASALATGLTRIPLDIAVSGSQTYSGTPTFVGSDTPPFNVTVNTKGLTCSTVNAPSGTTTPISPSLAVGSYTLVTSSCGGVTLSGARAADYQVVYTSATGDFVVNPASVDVAVSGSQSYGGPPTFSGTGNPPAGVTMITTGLACTQVSTSVSTSTSISPKLPAGNYTIVPTSCSGATLSGPNASNYAIVYTAATGDFTVAPVALTITASSQTMTFGSQPPIVTGNYQGFVNGDGPGSLTGTLTCSAGATSSSPPGQYPSSCTGVRSTNYVIQFVHGTTTVTNGTLDVTVSGSQTYLGTPSFVGSYTQPPGVTVDTSALACTRLSDGEQIGPNLSAGNYTLDISSCSGVNVSGPNAPYYNLSLSPGDFVVYPAPIVVTVSGQQTYGGTPSFTGSVDNGTLPQGITVSTSGVTCKEVGTSTQTEPIASTLRAGSDTIVGTSCSGASISGAGSSNYTPEYVGAPNGFTVVPAPLTVTASSQTTQFGVVPVVTANYQGFVNNETPAVLSGTLKCISGTVPASPPGQYASSCSGVSATNYTISFVTGTTTVTKATPLITVSGSQIWEGRPSFSATAPLVNAQLDTAGLTCTTVDISMSITPTLAVGPYTLAAGSCSGATVTGTDAQYYLPPTYSTYWGDYIVSGGPHGYWLVGSDGGIFTFGSALFYGSTGSLRLQRPVVGITPTANKGGYWLVASDGGVFAFGNAGFYGSIPGLGLNPAGSGLPHSLNAPVVGMVPTVDGGGYFMVASDGGVFAFGDARFEGSCPGIGGCSGPVVAVVPDATGNGYWVVTQTGNVYTFGDAPYLGGPGPNGAPVTSAVRTWDGHGYWILRGDGTVGAYGDARAFGGPTGSVGQLNPATAIFADSDSGGYWVADAEGGVFAYGDAPSDGSMAGTHLNGAIIAGTGF